MEQTTETTASGTPESINIKLPDKLPEEQGYRDEIHSELVSSAVLIHKALQEINSDPVKKKQFDKFLKNNVNNIIALTNMPDSVDPYGYFETGIFGLFMQQFPDLANAIEESTHNQIRVAKLIARKTLDHPDKEFERKVASPHNLCHRILPHKNDLPEVLPRALAGYSEEIHKLLEAISKQALGDTHSTNINADPQIALIEVMHSLLLRIKLRDFASNLGNDNTSIEPERKIKFLSRVLSLADSVSSNPAIGIGTDRNGLKLKTLIYNSRIIQDPEQVNRLQESYIEQNSEGLNNYNNSLQYIENTRDEPSFYKKFTDKLTKLFGVDKLADLLKRNQEFLTSYSTLGGAYTPENAWKVTMAYGDWMLVKLVNRLANGRFQIGTTKGFSNMRYDSKKDVLDSYASGIVVMASLLTPIQGFSTLYALGRAGYALLNRRSRNETEGTRVTFRQRIINTWKKLEETIRSQENNAEKVYFMMGVLASSIVQIAAPDKAVAFTMIADQVNRNASRVKNGVEFSETARKSSSKLRALMVGFRAGVIGSGLLRANSFVEGFNSNLAGLAGATQENAEIAGELGLNDGSTMSTPDLPETTEIHQLTVTHEPEITAQIGLNNTDGTTPYTSPSKIKIEELLEARSDTPVTPEPEITAQIGLSNPDETTPYTSPSKIKIEELLEARSDTPPPTLSERLAQVETTKYIVQPGDKLRSIALKYGLGDTWKYLAPFNAGLENPDLIIPGQEIYIPNAEQLKQIVNIEDLESFQVGENLPPELVESSWFKALNATYATEIPKPGDYVVIPRIDAEIPQETTPVAVESVNTGENPLSTPNPADTEHLTFLPQVGPTPPLNSVLPAGELQVSGSDILRDVPKPIQVISTTDYGLDPQAISGPQDYTFPTDRPSHLDTNPQENPVSDSVTKDYGLAPEASSGPQDYTLPNQVNNSPEVKPNSNYGLNSEAASSEQPFDNVNQTPSYLDRNPSTQSAQPNSQATDLDDNSSNDGGNSKGNNAQNLPVQVLSANELNTVTKTEGGIEVPNYVLADLSRNTYLPSDFYPKFVTRLPIELNGLENPEVQGIFVSEYILSDLRYLNEAIKAQFGESLKVTYGEVNYADLAERFEKAVMSFREKNPGLTDEEIEANVRNFVPPAGQNPAQLGTVIEINTQRNPEFIKWLNENAQKYNFVVLKSPTPDNILLRWLPK
jgi:LysM repeat protein